MTTPWFSLKQTPDNDGTMYGAQFTVLVDPDWMEFSMTGGDTRGLEFSLHLSDDQVQDLLNLEMEPAR